MVKHTTYYTNTNSVNSQIYNDYYTEYFTNKKLRAEGYLVDDKPDGHWKFYHINGELESEHWFIKGKFTYHIFQFRSFGAGKLPTNHD